MSKPAPPKNNILQSIMIMVMVWLGIQLFMKPGQDQQKAIAAQTPEAIYSQLVDANKFALEQTATTAARQYQSKIDDLVRARKLTPEDGDADKLKASVLLADTQYYNGQRFNDTNRVRAAYQMMHSLLGQYQSTPAWNTMAVSVWAKPQYNAPWSTITAAQLYDSIFQNLKHRNQTELVYGVIPGHAVVDALVSMTGRVPAFSYAFAAFLLAFLVRAIVYPLMQKQLMFSRQMSQLVPLTNEIKAKYKDEPAEQQKKVMELYKEYGINPLAGCFPALLQLPLFLTVYQCMLHYAFDFQQGTFLWINPVTSAATHGFTAPNLGELDHILIVIYGITMLSSTLLAPVNDPTQLKQQRLMGVGISVMWTVFMFFWPVPSGFVLYWTFTNVLSTAQSLRAYRLPMEPLQKVNAKGGGVYPKSPAGGKWMRMLEQMQQQAEDQKRGKDGGDGGNVKSSNGKPTNGKPGTGQIITGDFKTGIPVKHKPKKRK